MERQNMFYLVLINASFWLKEASSIQESVLTCKSETICAIAAIRDPNYSAYFYKKFEEYFNDAENNNNWDGNCILVGDIDTNPTTHQTLIPNDFMFKALVTSGNLAFTHDMSLTMDLGEMARKDGFDKSLVVGYKTFYMKEMNLVRSYRKAMVDCLQSGGILPMETTDEFVDQMSILAGDSTTPRFISLAYESTTDNVEKYLMWTTGLKEWKEGESLSECPRCQNWSFGNGGANLWAKINPVTKLYETVTSSETVAKFYCQYLGGNLATHKEVVASSFRSANDHPSFAVDGIIQLQTWHSLIGTLGGEWISIDLGTNYAITNVMFLPRSNSLAQRHHKLQVWIDGPKPTVGTALDIMDRILCGVYQFYQRNAQLSGVQCKNPTMGHRVTILNPWTNIHVHFDELAVHGFNPS